MLFKAGKFGTICYRQLISQRTGDVLLPSAFPSAAGSVRKGLRRLGRRHARSSSAIALAERRLCASLHLALDLGRPGPSLLLSQCILLSFPMGKLRLGGLSELSRARGPRRGVRCLASWPSLPRSRSSVPRFHLPKLLALPPCSSGSQGDRPQMWGQLSASASLQGNPDSRLHPRTTTERLLPLGARGPCAGCRLPVRPGPSRPPSQRPLLLTAQVAAGIATQVAPALPALPVSLLHSSVPLTGASSRPVVMFCFLECFCLASSPARP